MVQNLERRKCEGPPMSWGQRGRGWRLPSGVNQTEVGLGAGRWKGFWLVALLWKVHARPPCDRRLEGVVVASLDPVWLPLEAGLASVRRSVRSESTKYHLRHSKEGPSIQEGNCRGQRCGRHNPLFSLYIHLSCSCLASAACLFILFPRRQI